MGREGIIYDVQPCANVNCKNELVPCTNPNCHNQVGTKFNNTGIDTDRFKMRNQSMDNLGAEPSVGTSYIQPLSTERNLQPGASDVSTDHIQQPNLTGSANTQRMPPELRDQSSMNPERTGPFNFQPGLRAGTFNNSGMCNCGKSGENCTCNGMTNLNQLGTKTCNCGMRGGICTCNNGIDAGTTGFNRMGNKACNCGMRGGTCTCNNGIDAGTTGFNRMGNKACNCGMRGGICTCNGMSTGQAFNSNMNPSGSPCNYCNQNNGRYSMSNGMNGASFQNTGMNTGALNYSSMGGYNTSMGNGTFNNTSNGTFNNTSNGTFNNGMLDPRGRMQAEQSRALTHLKAEHQRQVAALRAQEIQKKADLKAQHAKTPGGTGLMSKLLGTEDPLKKAEKRQLNAEIARAEAIIRADHARERAELEARNAKDAAALAADEQLRSQQLHQRAGIYNNNFGNGAFQNNSFGNTSSFGTNTNTFTKQPIMTQPPVTQHSTTAPRMQPATQPVTQSVLAQPVVPVVPVMTQTTARTHALPTQSSLPNTAMPANDARTTYPPNAASLV